MKKIVIGFYVGLSCLFLLSGCSSPNNQKEASTDDKTETSTFESDKSSKNLTKEKTNDNAVSTDILAGGDYIVGTDIEPGAYYAVLTDMQYGSDDENQNGYVSIDVISEEQTTDSSDGEDVDYSFEMLEEIGEKRRFVLKDGDKVIFSDNWDPISWEVKLLNEKDFRDYMKDNK
ncbi:hypothetical protein [Enterococcus pallens]|uniref:DUF4825 domain-containing protein n=1 Tax=Enterococcus pallens ATCC BAA-351 TaxID=1158607 RepID=R2PQB7_9ENTE|nr:hypothetical protein [Enterococcus pallens]EOH86742.1 hypothetical protein UAU_05188 [Enterococcus pallens ATCC BAA-351]EOU18538.1 hypothetical protein I588_03533 [Enterococcus pallens ATCC BAA-351]OJG76554.1 hypothetical protein RV10_GL003691 [Enterococcus pallens]